MNRMSLEQVYGYSPSVKGRRRRRRLKKAIQDMNFDAVFDQLKDLAESYEGYKADRAVNDLKFLKSRKERYFTEKDSYEVRPLEEGLTRRSA